MAKPAKDRPDKKWMPGKWWMKGEWQFKDRKGEYFRANGRPCCGCGHNRQVNNLAADQSSSPANRKPRWE